MSAFKAFERKLTWSVDWLFWGREPTRGEHERPYKKGTSEYDRAHKNKFLADGYFGVLWCLSGDLDHMSSRWGLNSAGSPTPCSCCAANSDDHDKPWTDGRLATAAWVRSIWTNATWAAAFPNRSYIFRTLPGFGVEQYIPDLMHTLHLGAYHYMFASVMALLTHHHLAGSVEANLQQVWGAIKEAYQDLQKI